MDQRQHTREILKQEQVLEIVRAYKRAIGHIVSNPKVYLYGSYSKGTARVGSDIDVAVVVNQTEDHFGVSAKLWEAVRGVHTDIEPILIEEGRQKGHPSPLYQDVLKTGIAL